MKVTEGATYALKSPKSIHTHRRVISIFKHNNIDTVCYSYGADKNRLCQLKTFQRAIAKKI